MCPGQAVSVTQTQPAHTGDAAGSVTPDDLRRLRRWNVGLTVVHASQGLAILLLAGGFSIMVTSSYPTGPPGSSAPAPSPLFEVRIGLAVAIFLFLAAADHLVTSTVLRKPYEAGLRGGINRFRWIEYSFSATTWWC